MQLFHHQYHLDTSSNLLPFCCYNTVTVTVTDFLPIPLLPALVCQPSSSSELNNFIRVGEMRLLWCARSSIFHLNPKEAIRITPFRRAGPSWVFWRKNRVQEGKGCKRARGIQESSVSLTEYRPYHWFNIICIADWMSFVSLKIDQISSVLTTKYRPYWRPKIVCIDVRIFSASLILWRKIVRLAGLFCCAWLRSQVWRKVFATFPTSLPRRS